MSPTVTCINNADLSGSFLVLENISKVFKNFQALDGVNLEISKGSTIALVGPSGSGKSTLLRILGGFENPSAGRIWIDGDAEGIEKVLSAISMIEREAITFGLTDRIEEFLKKDAKDVR